MRRDFLYASEWRIGLYVKEAFSTVLDHCFNKAATSEYPDAPLFSSDEERERVERAREQARMERNKRAFEEQVALANTHLREQRQGEHGA